VGVAQTQCLKIQPEQFPADIQETFLKIPENVYATSHTISNAGEDHSDPVYLKTSYF